jgi:hypothetical protein
VAHSAEKFKVLRKNFRSFLFLVSFLTQLYPDPDTTMQCHRVTLARVWRAEGADPYPPFLYTKEEG